MINSRSVIFCPVYPLWVVWKLESKPSRIQGPKKKKRKKKRIKKRKKKKRK